MVQSPLKWAGGKSGLVRKVIALFPPDYKERTYHEPFFGGGAVFFKIRPRSGTINDLNPHLINFYRIVKERPEELISQASQYRHDKQTYYELRRKFNQEDLSALERAALLLYLNKTAYNGLYRVNSMGKFNVPFGCYSNPRIVNEEKILRASEALKRVEILNDDFEYLIGKASQGDICYLDPPYQPVSETSNFTEYAPKGFSFEEQVRLRDLCRELDRKGVLLVLSNSHSEPILNIYGGDAFKIVVIESKRAISSKVSTRGPVEEVLITNAPLEFTQRLDCSPPSYQQDI